MPWKEAHKSYPNTGWPARYVYPAPGGVPGFELRASDIDRLETWRKEAIRERDEAMAAQKACEKPPRNIDAARWYREEAARWMKRYRAVCLIAGDTGWLGLPKDCARRPYEEWSEELAPFCDDIYRAIQAL